MLTTKQIIEKYGKPDDDGSDYLIAIDLPYPMRISWDLKTSVKRIKCHKLIADKLYSGLANLAVLLLAFKAFLTGSKSLAIPQVCLDLS